MTHFATFARVTWCTTFVVALVSACGGQSLKGRDTGDAGAAGIAPTGGSSGHAGSKATGGTSGTGTTADTGTTAGTGTTWDEACTGPSDDNLDSGCSAYFLRWTHDEATGLCLPTAYGGCGATKNNYETLAACQKACPNGNPNYDSCQVATDCALGNVGCCGVCDGPEVTTHDFIAYNKQYEAQARQCQGDVACGACLPVEPTQNTRQNFIANCVRGECVVEDIRESDVSACKVNADCQLRRGTACCGGCGDLVAVRGDGSLEKLVCGDTTLLPCKICDDLPPNAEAQCSAQGHCIVRYLRGEQ